MTAQQTFGAHSAVVKMDLILNGTVLRVNQMGGDFLFIDSPADYPPCEATVVLEIDDYRSERLVALPHGISKNCERVQLALCEQPPVGNPSV